MDISSLSISPVAEEEDEDVVQTDDIEDEISDEEEEGELMTLGFVVKPETPWSLFRQYFPSKAGGTPAWLDPKNLPTGKSTLCDFCGDPLQFVLQVYVPLGEESTFHRSLYVVMCPSMVCLLRDQHEQWKRPPEVPSRSVKVFRCQLPRENSFYSSNAPAGDGTTQALTNGAPLCSWCGTWKGEKLCGSCRRARYCSSKHQSAHWRSSNSSHRVSCRKVEISHKESEPGLFDSAPVSNTLWPEHKIIDEDEGKDDDENSNDNESAGSLISRSRTEGSYGKWMKHFPGNGDNRSWASFQERISRAPDQILRYCNSGQAKPLWPVSGGRPSMHDIPKCNYCGGTRVFELQVLPQLLYFFNIENTEGSLDWATIVIYTCEQSCNGDIAYNEEFPWIQLAS